jgi:hypothetical protein
MRQKFPAYYRVAKDKLIERFDDLVFVFDASALLDVFRLKKESTEEIFNVIELYKNQIVVPYQAAWEYNCNIHRVLNEQLRNINSAEKTLCDFVEALSAKRQQPYISQKAARLLKQLQNQITRDFKEQREYVEGQLIHGQLMNRMADQLDGRVLTSFSEVDIKKIEEEGAKRYQEKVPPGYKDEAKDSNRFGDLIIWQEILRFAKENGKSVIYVTNDAKEDWVIRENGKTIGPQYALIEEFYKETENAELLFHIYSLEWFLTFIRDKNDSVVSEETIDSVREIIQRSDNSVSSLTRDKQDAAVLCGQESKETIAGAEEKQSSDSPLEKMKGMNADEKA